MTDYLPSIFAFLGVIITVYFNYKLGRVKETSEGKAVQITAEGQFRDHLLALIKEYDNKIDAQDQKIETLRVEVDTLKTERRELLTENVVLKRRVSDLEDELAKFERKVYYRGNQS